MRHVLLTAALVLTACSGPPPAQQFVQDALTGKVDAQALGLESFDAYSISEKDVVLGSYQTIEGATFMLAYATGEGLTFTESWEDAQNSYTDIDLDCKVDRAALSNVESFEPKLVTFGTDPTASTTERTDAQERFSAMAARFGLMCSA